MRASASRDPNALDPAVTVARGALGDARERSVRAADRVRADVAERLHAGPRRLLLDASEFLADASVAVRNDHEAALAAIGRARAALSLGIEELQVVARGIHPVLLDQRGLDAALENLADACPVRVTVTGRAGRRLGEAPELAAYHLVDGALRAAARTGRATAIAVDVRVRGDELWVEVADDAAGDDRTTVDRRDLLEVSDRLADLGAQLTIGRARWGGIVVRAGLPVTADA
jgi:signal transduction histidine kinase